MNQNARLSNNSTRVQEASQIHDQVFTERRAGLNSGAAANVYQCPCGSFQALKCQCRKLRIAWCTYLIRCIVGLSHSHWCADKHWSPPSQIEVWNVIVSTIVPSRPGNTKAFMTRAILHLGSELGLEIGYPAPMPNLVAIFQPSGNIWRRFDQKVFQIPRMYCILLYGEVGTH